MSRQGISWSTKLKPHGHELSSYLHYLFARRDIGGVARLLTRAAHVRRDRRRAPDALTLDLAPVATSCSNLSQTVRLPLRLRPAGERSATLTIPLATRDWSFSDGPPWDAGFEDPEDASAAHRFAWLQPLLSAAPSWNAMGLASVVTQWIGANPYRDGAPGWDSYSIAERIANWAYLLAALPRVADDSHAKRTLGQIALSLHLQSEILRSHLEFRGT
ncbi:MAG TPA: hypothetical protein VGY54_03905, partial [Polyangiaceae bacterium]|nr:hypothetical protein [Polyangiaceae bacterium]